MEISQAITTHNVRIDGKMIQYYRAGESGEPVVLLHGGGTDSALLSWKHTLPAVGDQYRVYALDWPGYGQSDYLDGDYSLDKLVPVLDGLLDHWKIARASLVGLSMGGGAALAYALQHPDRVKSLVLVDTYGLQSQIPGGKLSYIFLQMPFLTHSTWKAIRNDKGMVRSALRGIFADAQAITDEMVNEVFEAIQDRRSEISFYSFQRYEAKWNGLRTNFRDRLKEIAAPTLFIHGDHDKLVPLDEVRRGADSMPQGRLAVMENSGHWPSREHPAVFNRLVLDFLAGLA